MHATSSAGGAAGAPSPFVRAVRSLSASRLWRHGVRRRWAYAVLGSAVIFTLSSLPLSLPGGVPLIDTWAHTLAYFTLGLAYQNVATRGWLMAAPGRLAAGFGALALYGLSDELHQAFVPGRFCELSDWLADLAGGGLALGASLALARALRPATPLRAGGGEPAPPSGARPPGPSAPG
ncbi:MAG: VanZ family protein [Candidatus Lambdaproteobacteria bacterium]|nr:VanZ family protein [Candidatus Lambdaproteobacteria bacterium]